MRGWMKTRQWIRKRRRKREIKKQWIIKLKKKDGEGKRIRRINRKPLPNRRLRPVQTAFPIHLNPKRHLPLHRDQNHQQPNQVRKIQRQKSNTQNIRIISPGHLYKICSYCKLKEGENRQKKTGQEARFFKIRFGKIYTLK